MSLKKTILAGTLAWLVGSGYYTLYKRFEHHPHPFREIIRWPNNKICAKIDDLFERYRELRDTIGKAINNLPRVYVFSLIPKA